MRDDKILIITQARFCSTRLPGKVLKKIQGKPMLQIHLERLKRSKLADAVLVATTEEPEAEEIVAIAKKTDCLYFQGSLNNVLDRYYHAARMHQAAYIVRVTSDCPLNDGLLVDQVIQEFRKTDFQYFSNLHPPTYPDGMDVEIFTFEALEKAHAQAKDQKDLEHVSYYIYRHPKDFRVGSMRQQEDLSELRLTVDNEADFQLIEKLVKKFGTNEPWLTYAQELSSKPKDYPEGFRKRL